MTKDFDILGQKVRLNIDPNSATTSPDEIVDYVRAVASKIKDSAPNLDSGKIFLLTALKIAEERTELSTNIEKTLMFFTLRYQMHLELLIRQQLSSFE